MWCVVSNKPLPINIDKPACDLSNYFNTREEAIDRIQNQPMSAWVFGGYDSLPTKVLVHWESYSLIDSFGIIINDSLAFNTEVEAIEYALRLSDLAPESVVLSAFFSRYQDLCH